MVLGDLQRIHYDNAWVCCGIDLSDSNARARRSHVVRGLMIMLNTFNSRAGCCRSEVVIDRGIEHVAWQVHDHWSAIAMLQRLERTLNLLTTSTAAI